MIKARAIFPSSLKLHQNLRIASAKAMSDKGWNAASALGKRMKMSGYLTTHVLDTARGCPAVGLEIGLFRIEDKRRGQLCSVVTNSDGRTDGPILSEAEFEIGVYELVFHAGPYLEAAGAGFDGFEADGLPFLNAVPVRFGMSMARHYHVPLLLSPFGYSTYRGS
jgi:5-hydroxyisourate hydrolase